MKSSIFWDITPCSLLKVTRLVWRTCCLHLYGWRVRCARNQHEAVNKHTLEHGRWSWQVPPKRRLTFNGLHGVISQKIVLLLTFFMLKTKYLVEFEVIMKNAIVYMLWHGVIWSKFMDVSEELIASNLLPACWSFGWHSPQLKTLRPSVSLNRRWTSTRLDGITEVVLLAKYPV
jgi:hypothetical protein